MMSGCPLQSNSIKRSFNVAMSYLQFFGFASLSFHLGKSESLVLRLVRSLYMLIISITYSLNLFEPTAHYQADQYQDR